MSRQYVSEFLGTLLLLTTVVGSGIMGETLAGGNLAIALLANALATASALYVLITIFAPLSGAHFNPVVTLARSLSDTFAGIAPSSVPAFMMAQAVCSILAVLVARNLFP